MNNGDIIFLINVGVIAALVIPSGIISVINLLKCV